MIIAVDFDGTCVTHEFPKVGKDIGAVPVLKKLIEKGHKIILYTMRSHPDENNQGKTLSGEVVLMILYRMLLTGSKRMEYLYGE